MRLGAEERREDVDRGLGQADAVVAHRDLDGVAPRRRGGDGDTPVTVGVPLHGLERIAQQVEDDLLDLHPIAQDRGQLAREVELDLDAELAGVALDHLGGVADQRVQVGRLPLGGLLAHQVAHAPDDLAGAQRLVGHRLEDRQELRGSHRPVAHAEHGALRVVGDRPERLVDLVGEAGGHLADGAEAEDVGQLGLVLAGLLLGALALRDVGGDAPDAHRPTVGRRTAET